MSTMHAGQRMKIAPALLAALLLASAAEAKTLVVNPALAGRRMTPTQDRTGNHCGPSAARRWWCRRGTWCGSTPAFTARGSPLPNPERRSSRSASRPLRAQTVVITRGRSANGLEQRVRRAATASPGPSTVPGRRPQSGRRGAGVRRRHLAAQGPKPEGIDRRDVLRGPRAQAAPSADQPQSRRNPRERPIEGSTRSEVWVVGGSHVQTCGLRFRCAANRAQQAMAQFRGDHDLVEDCTFEWSNSTGASFRG